MFLSFCERQHDPALRKGQCEERAGSIDLQRRVLSGMNTCETARGWKTQRQMWSSLWVSKDSYAPSGSCLICSCEDRSVSRVPIHTLLWGTSQEQWENHPRRWEDTVPALTLGMESVPSSQIRKPTTHGVVSRALRKRAQEWGKLAPTEHCSRPDSQVLQANQRGPNCCQVTYTHTPSGRLIWI